MKKKFRFMIASIMLLVMFGVGLMKSYDVYANSNLAVSAGMLYSDIDTRQDAKDASAAYGSAGYTTVTMESPRMAQFTTPRLAAGVIFLSGHGAASHMSFEPEFSIYCQSGSVTSTDLNIYSTASNQKLITFAGCETAKGSTGNITYRAYLVGAEAAVGWTTKVAAASHTNWLKRYNNALAEGYTLSNAMAYANSYIYLPGSNVKDGLYWGNGNLTITSSKSTSALSVEETNANQLFVANGYTVVTSGDELLSKENATIVAKVKTLLTSKERVYEDAELISYIHENDQGKMIDVYFKRSDVITNMAMTMQLDNNGTVKYYKLHNMPSENLTTSRAQLDNVTVKHATDVFKENIAEQEAKRISENDCVLEQSQFEYYEMDTNQTYVVTYTTVLDATGAKYVLQDMTMIK